MTTKSTSVAPAQWPEQPRNFPDHLLVRMLIAGLKTPEHVSDWIDTVALMSREQRATAFGGVDGPVTFMVVGYQVCATEEEKPPEQRDWRSVAAALEGLAGKARKLAIEGLWAAFVRSRIITQSEFCKDLDGAKRIATEALDIASADPGVRFLIAGTLGRQYVLAKRLDDAQFWLRMALQKDASSIFQHERMLVLLAASHAFGETNPASGVEYAKQAVAVAEGGEFIPAIEKARVYAELAVAEFFVGGAKAAFPSWDRAGQYLFAVMDRRDEWKDLAVIFGHNGYYLWKTAQTGRPPEFTPAGEVYSPPVRGVFLTSNPARIPFFNERAQGGLWRVMGSYAEAVGVHGRASIWNSRATGAAEEQGFTPLLLINIRESVPRLLREKGHEHTIREARKSGIALVVYKREREAGRDPIRPDLDIMEAANHLSESDRTTAEDFGALTGLVPAILSVATLAINERSREQAKREAAKVVEVCRTIAPISLAPSLWLSLAQAVEKAFVNGEGCEEITRWRKTLPPQPSSLAVVLRIAASAEATAQQALENLLPAVVEMCKMYPPEQSVHREILLPYFEAYWTDVLEHRRFQFGNAMAVEHSLPTAKQLPHAERLVGVFRAIYKGFTIRGGLPEEIRAWLFGGPGSQTGS